MDVVVTHDGAIHPGGAVKVVLETAHALDADLVVGISKMDKSWWEEQAPNDVRILNQQSKMGTIQDLFNARRMMKLNLNEYDIVITSGPASKFFQPYDDQLHVHYMHHPPLAKLWFEGGLFSYIQTVVDKIETTSIPKVITNSEFTADRYYKHYGNYADAVVNPPVNTKKFKGNEKHQSGKFVMVGRLEDRKRPLLARAAFEQLAKEYRNTDFPLPDPPQLHFLGDGPLREELESTGTDNVTVHGYVDEDDLIQHVSTSDAGIFLAKREDFGITPIEYMTAGLSVLGVDEPNTNNQVTKETGVLVEPTVEAVKRGVRDVVRKSWNRQSIQDEAERYNADRFRKDIREVIYGE